MRDGQTSEPPKAEDDAYVDASGLYVFTSTSLRRRGTCCGNKCRHCPYGWSAVDVARIAPGERPVDSRSWPTSNEACNRDA